MNDEKMEKFRFCSKCLVCGEVAKKFAHPQQVEPCICSDCKEAIMFAKEQRKLRKLMSYAVRYVDVEDD